MNKKSYATKIISVTLVSAIFSTNCAFAYVQETSVWATRRNAQRAAAPVDFSIPPQYAPLISPVPAKFGSVADTIVPTNPNGKEIFLIQDIHANEEAQRNIGGMLEALSQPKPLDVIGLEGTTGDLPLEPFLKFPYKKSLAAAAAYHLKTHIMSGPVFSALTSSLKVKTMTGLEDTALYEANKRAFVDAHPRVEAFRAAWTDDTARLQLSKRALFNSSLAVFDAHVEAYRTKQRSLADHLRELTQLSEASPAAVRNFLKAVSLEGQIDFKRASAEREKFIRDLQTSDPQRLWSVLPLRYPAFHAFLTYDRLASELRADQLLADAETLQADVYAKLTHTAEERALIRKSDELYFTGKLLEFALTPAEWKSYRNLRSNAELAPFEQFFEIADQRNAAFVKNLLDSIAHSKATRAALVAGGFHAEGVAASLANAGYRVTILRPRITSADKLDGSAYLNRFLEGKTPLDKLFDGERLFLGAAPWKPRELALDAAAEAERTKEGTLSSALNYFRPYFQMPSVKSVAAKGDDFVAELVFKAEKAAVTFLFDEDGNLKGNTIAAVTAGTGMWSIINAQLIHSPLPIYVWGMCSLSLFLITLIFLPNRLLVTSHKRFSILEHNVVFAVGRSDHRKKIPTSYPPIPRDFEQALGEQAKAAWEKLADQKTYWGKLFAEHPRAVAWAVNRIFDIACRTDSDLKTLGDLKQSHFQDIVIPEIGKSIQGFYLWYMRELQRRKAEKQAIVSLEIVDSMLMELGMIAPKKGIEEIKTTDELKEFLSESRTGRVDWEKMQQPLFQRLVDEFVARYRGFNLKTYLAEPYEIRKKNALQITSSAFLDASVLISVLDGDFSRVYHYYGLRVHSSHKTARWLILEKAGYIASSVLALDKITTLEDFSNLITAQAILPQYIPWYLIVECNKPFIATCARNISAVAFYGARNSDEAKEKVSSVTIDDMLRLRKEHFESAGPILSDEVPGFGTSLYGHILGKDQHRYDRLVSLELLQACDLIPELVPPNQIASFRSLQAYLLITPSKEIAFPWTRVLPRPLLRQEYFQTALAIGNEKVRRNWHLQQIPNQGAIHSTVGITRIRKRFLKKSEQGTTVPRAHKRHLVATRLGFVLDATTLQACVTQVNKAVRIFYRQQSKLAAFPELNDLFSKLGGASVNETVGDLKNHLETLERINLEIIRGAYSKEKRMESEEWRTLQQGFSAYWQLLDTAYMLPAVYISIVKSDVSKSPQYLRSLFELAKEAKKTDAAQFTYPVIPFETSDEAIRYLSQLRGDKRYGNQANRNRKLKSLEEETNINLIGRIVALAASESIQERRIFLKRVSHDPSGVLKDLADALAYNRPELWSHFLQLISSRAWQTVLEASGVERQRYETFATAFGKRIKSLNGSASIPFIKTSFAYLSKRFLDEETARIVYRRAVAWVAEAPFAPGFGGLFWAIVIKAIFPVEMETAWVLGNAVAAIMFGVVHYIGSRSPPDWRVAVVSIAGFFFSFMFPSHDLSFGSAFPSTSILGILHLILNNTDFSFLNTAFDEVASPFQFAVAAPSLSALAKNSVVLSQGTPNPAKAEVVANGTFGVEIQRDFSDWMRGMMPDDWETVLFFPGMDYKDPQNWWNRQLSRPPPLLYHSGFDIAVGLTKNGEKAPIPLGTEVTAPLDGRVITVFNDEMQQTVFLETNYVNSNGERLVLQLSHLELASGMEEGRIVKRGDVVGRIVPSRHKGAMVARHLHFGAAWMSGRAIKRVAKEVAEWRAAQALAADAKTADRTDVIWTRLDKLIIEGVFDFFDPKTLFENNGGAVFKKVSHAETEAVLLIHPTKKPPLYQLAQIINYANPGILLWDVRGTDPGMEYQSNGWDLEAARCMEAATQIVAVIATHPEAIADWLNGFGLVGIPLLSFFDGDPSIQTSLDRVRKTRVLLERPLSEFTADNNGIRNVGSFLRGFWQDHWTALGVPNAEELYGRLLDIFHKEVGREDIESGVQPVLHQMLLSSRYLLPPDPSEPKEVPMGDDDIQAGASIPFLENAFVFLSKRFFEKETARIVYRRAVAWVAEAPFAPGLGGLLWAIVIKAIFPIDMETAWVLGNAIAAIVFGILHTVGSRAPPDWRVAVVSLTGFVLSQVTQPNAATVLLSFIHLLLNNVDDSDIEALLNSFQPFQPALLTTHGWYGKSRNGAVFLKANLSKIPSSPKRRITWKENAGLVKGSEDFPKDLRVLLNQQKQVAARIVAIVDYLGWTPTELVKRAGVGKNMLQRLRAEPERIVRAPQVIKMAEALKVSPLYLFTGKSEEESFEKNTLSQRLQYLLYKERVTIEKLSERTKRSVDSIENDIYLGREFRRSTIHVYANALGVSPVFLETGFKPNMPIDRGSFSGDAYQRRYSTSDHRKKNAAQDLLIRVLRKWGGGPQEVEVEENVELLIKGGNPDDRKASVIDRFYKASPDQLRRMVYYDLITAEMAEKFRRGENLAALFDPFVDGLLRQRKELLEFFEENPSYTPPYIGYQNRVLNVWDFLGRGYNRNRLLAILDHTAEETYELKRKISISSNLEGEILLQKINSDAPVHDSIQKLFTVVRNGWTIEPMETESASVESFARPSRYSIDTANKIVGAVEARVKIIDQLITKNSGKVKSAVVNSGDIEWLFEGIDGQRVPFIRFVLQVLSAMGPESIGQEATLFERCAADWKSQTAVAAAVENLRQVFKHRNAKRGEILALLSQRNYLPDDATLEKVAGFEDGDRRMQTQLMLLFKNHTESASRSRIISAIGNIQPLHKDAIELLIKCSNSDDLTISYAARTAILNSGLASLSTLKAIVNGGVSLTPFGSEGEQKLLNHASDEIRHLWDWCISSSRPSGKPLKIAELIDIEIAKSYLASDGKVSKAAKAFGITETSMRFRWGKIGITDAASAVSFLKNKHVQDVTSERWTIYDIVPLEELKENEVLISLVQSDGRVMTAAGFLGVDKNTIRRILLRRGVELWKYEKKGKIEHRKLLEIAQQRLRRVCLPRAFERVEARYESLNRRKSATEINPQQSASIPFLETVFVVISQRFLNEETARIVYRRAVAWVAEAPFAPGLGGLLWAIVIKAIFPVDMKTAWVIGNAISVIVFTVAHTIGSRSPPDWRVFAVSLVGFLLSWAFPSTDLSFASTLPATLTLSVFHLFLNNVSEFARKDIQDKKHFLWVAFFAPFIEAAMLMAGREIWFGLFDKTIGSHLLLWVTLAFAGVLIHADGVRVGQDPELRPTTVAQFFQRLLRWSIYSGLFILGSTYSPALGASLAFWTHLIWNRYAFFNEGVVDAIRLYLFFETPQRFRKDQASREEWWDRYAERDLVPGNLSAPLDVVYRKAPMIDLEEFEFDDEMIGHHLTTRVFPAYRIGIPFLKAAVERARSRGLAITHEQAGQMLSDPEKFRRLVWYIHPYYERAKKTKDDFVTVGEDHVWAYYVAWAVTDDVKAKYGQRPVMINIDPHEDLEGLGDNPPTITGSVWATWARRNKLITDYYTCTRRVGDGRWEIFHVVDNGRTEDLVEVSPTEFREQMKGRPWLLSFDADELSLDNDRIREELIRRAAEVKMTLTLDGEYAANRHTEPEGFNAYVKNLVPLFDGLRPPERVIGAVSRDYLDQEKATPMWISEFSMFLRQFAENAFGSYEGYLRLHFPSHLIGKPELAQWRAAVMDNHERGMRSSSLQEAYRVALPLNLIAMGCDADNLALHINQYIRWTMKMGMGLLKSLAEAEGFTATTVLAKITTIEGARRLLSYLHPYRKKAIADKDVYVASAGSHEFTYYRLKNLQEKTKGKINIVNVDPHYDYFLSKEQYETAPERTIASQTWGTHALLDGLAQNLYTVFKDGDSWKVLHITAVSPYAKGQRIISLEDLLRELKGAPYYLTIDADFFSCKINPSNDAAQYRHAIRTFNLDPAEHSFEAMFHTRSGIHRHIEPDAFDGDLGPLLSGLAKNVGAPIQVDSVLSYDYLQFPRVNDAWLAAFRKFVPTAIKKYFPATSNASSTDRDGIRYHFVPPQYRGDKAAWLARWRAAVPLPAGAPMSIEDAFQRIPPTNLEALGFTDDTIGEHLTHPNHPNARSSIGFFKELARRDRLAGGTIQDTDIYRSYPDPVAFRGIRTVLHPYHRRAVQQKDDFVTFGEDHVWAYYVMEALKDQFLQKNGSVPIMVNIDPHDDVVDETGAQIVADLSWAKWALQDGLIRVYYQVTKGQDGGWYCRRITSENGVETFTEMPVESMFEELKNNPYVLTLDADELSTNHRVASIDFTDFGTGERVFVPVGDPDFEATMEKYGLPLQFHTPVAQFPDHFEDLFHSLITVSGRAPERVIGAISRDYLAPDADETWISDFKNFVHALAKHYFAEPASAPSSDYHDVVVEKLEDMQFSYGSVPAEYQNRRFDWWKPYAIRDVEDHLRPGTAADVYPSVEPLNLTGYGFTDEMIGWHLTHYVDPSKKRGLAFVKALVRRAQAAGDPIADAGVIKALDDREAFRRLTWYLHPYRALAEAEKDQYVTVHDDHVWGYHLLRALRKEMREKHGDKKPVMVSVDPHPDLSPRTTKRDVIDDATWATWALQDGLIQAHYLLTQRSDGTWECQRALPGKDRYEDLQKVSTDELKTVLRDNPAILSIDADELSLDETHVKEISPGQPKTRHINPRDFPFYLRGVFDIFKEAERRPERIIGAISYSYLLEKKADAAWIEAFKAFLRGKGSAAILPFIMLPSFMDESMQHWMATAIQALIVLSFVSLVILSVRPFFRTRNIQNRAYYVWATFFMPLVESLGLAVGKEIWLKFFDDSVQSHVFLWVALAFVGVLIHADGVRIGQNPELQPTTAVQFWQRLVRWLVYSGLFVLGSIYSPVLGVALAFWAHTVWDHYAFFNNEALDIGWPDWSANPNDLYEKLKTKRFSFYSVPRKYQGDRAAWWARYVPEDYVTWNSPGSAAAVYAAAEPINLDAFEFDDEMIGFHLTNAVDPETKKGVRFLKALVQRAQKTGEWITDDDVAEALQNRDKFLWLTWHLHPYRKKAQMQKNEYLTFQEDHVWGYHLLRAALKEIINKNAGKRPVLINVDPHPDLVSANDTHQSLDGSSWVTWALRDRMIQSYYVMTRRSDGSWSCRRAVLGADEHDQIGEAYLDLSTSLEAQVKDNPVVLSIDLDEFSLYNRNYEYLPGVPHYRHVDPAQIEEYLRPVLDILTRAGRAPERVIGAISRDYLAVEADEAWITAARASITQFIRKRFFPVTLLPSLMFLGLSTENMREWTATSLLALMTVSVISIGIVVCRRLFSVEKTKRGYGLADLNGDFLPMHPVGFPNSDDASKPEKVLGSRLDFERKRQRLLQGAA